MRSISEVTSYQWNNFCCAKCKTSNWIFVGEIGDDDPSGYDPDGVRCYKCKEPYHFLSDIEIEIRKKQNPNWKKNLNIETAEKKPKQ